ncbi:MAG: hypothetical protein KatS3mg124_0109 [Porticoccaceae bacterium]|nr:MAG: hypothetical protein KatS3mg124_0109 [Porticoccaceae bacterium]
MDLERLLAREAIRELVNRYTLAGDALDVEGYVACFAPDGVLEFADFPGRGPLRLEGREAIRAFAVDFFAAVRQGAIPGGVMRHHLTTVEIEVEGESARGIAYCLYLDGGGARRSGVYTDRFCRREGRWLIAHRRFAVDF